MRSVSWTTGISSIDYGVGNKLTTQRGQVYGDHSNATTNDESVQPRRDADK